jgi:hypothetical protein
MTACLATANDQDIKRRSIETQGQELTFTLGRSADTLRYIPGLQHRMAKIIISYLFNRLLWKEWFPFGSDLSHDFFRSKFACVKNMSLSGS